MIRRRAFTLVESVIAMSAASTIMLLAIGLVHQAMRLANDSKNQSEHRQSIARLSIQFRRDIHNALSVVTETPSHQIIELDVGVRVEYRSIGNNVERVSTNNNASSRESELYRFVHGCSAVFESSKTEVEALGGPLYTATLDVSLAPIADGFSKRTEMHVTAAVGTLSHIVSSSDPVLKGTSKP